MKTSKIPTTVDEYLKDFPPDVRRALNRLRKEIRAAAPEAQEVISYRVPGYKHNGMLVFFAGFPRHCSFFVVDKNILSTFSDALTGFRTTGTTIQFTPEKQLPAALVRRIVKLRLQGNNERKQARELYAPSKAKGSKKAAVKKSGQRPVA